MSRSVILVQLMNQFADLLSPLVRTLSAQGYDAVLVHTGDSFLPAEDKYDFRKSDFIHILDLEDDLRPRQIASSASLAQDAAALETQLGVKLIEAIRSDRHLGHGFVVGAEYARSHYGTSTNFDQAIDVAMRVAKRLDGVFERSRVAAVIAAPSSLHGNLIVALAASKGIPVRVPSLTPGSRFYWAVNKYYFPADLAQRYAQALATTPNSPEDETPRVMPRSARAEGWIASFREMTSISYLTMRCYRLVRREVGNRIKRRGRIYGRYLLGESLRQSWRTWLARRAVLHQRDLTPELPDDLPFVLLPLSVEPESTLMAESPSCDNQLALVDAAAKTLPAGWRLVVKEHPAFTTPRPPGFWRQIRAYPNVLIASPLESGETLMLKARAVLMIRSTLGLQAALAGVPVVTPHPGYAACLLPHVQFAPGYHELEASFRAIAMDQLPPLSERRRAARVLNTTLEQGVPITDRNLIKGVAGGDPIDAEIVSAIAVALGRSLPRIEPSASLVTSEIVAAEV